MNKYQRPLFKWAGGKYQLLDAILPHLPKGNRLIEPFVGAGVVFLNTEYSEYLLNDLNADVIYALKAVQQSPEAFIKQVKRWFKPEYNESEKFYELRERFNRTPRGITRCGLFAYLNQHAFNGLCRYNRQGKFNVPFGDKPKPRFPLERIPHIHQKLQNATLYHDDFIKIMNKAEPGDVIYCDPPYHPLSPSSSFTQYSGKVFEDIDQQRLAQKAKELAGKGICTVISNNATPFIIELYEGAKIHTTKSFRYIGANSREHVDEVIAVFCGKN